MIAAPDSTEVQGFDALSSLAYDEAGLVLAPRKAALIRSRLRHRLRALDMEDLSDYCAFVRADPAGVERLHMISALTTNVTSFFREPHHFDHLLSVVLPRMLAELDAGRPVRVWSAGCSTGQEPYSIAMALLDACPRLAMADFRILATDIDPNVLNVARRARYAARDRAGLAPELVEKFTVPVMDDGGTDGFEMSADLRRLVAFKPLNLIADWPLTRKVDAIFCRNVVIYFDAPTQALLWEKFHDILKPDGVIFVGHSERIADDRFRLADATAYRKSSGRQD